MRIFGRKTITLPTPLIIPSTNMSFNGPLGIRPFIERLIHATPASIQFMGYSPKVKVVKKVSQIKKMKIGNPKSLWVINVSIISVVCLFFMLLSW